MNSNILARLEELRKWQCKQQERLQTSRRGSQFEDDLKETAAISIQETPIGTKPLKSTQKLNQSNKNRNDNESVNSPIVIDGQSGKRMPAKREFLRRGSGLVRYKMTQEDSKTPYGKRISIKKNKMCEMKNDENEHLEQNFEEVLKSDQNVPSPLKLPVDYEVKFDDEMNSLKIDEDILIKQTISNINEIASVKTTPATREDDVNPLRNDEVPYEVSDETLLNERELLIFEALEEKILNSSFSSTNSSILKILSSTPNKLKSLRNKKDAEIDQLKKEIVEESSFCSSLSSETSQKSESENETENDTKSVCSENESRTISTSDSTIEESTQRDDSSSNEITLSENKIEPSKDEILMEKLKILDEEIEKFRRENGNLQRRQFEIDRESEKLEKDKRMFEKFVLEEKVKIEFYLEEEKKAFAKEKLIFERYVKDVQSRTNRKEREEIIQLKDELATVKEAAKLKDRRNATSQARLRNQIKNYEKDIGRLKDEIDSLRKQNAKIINEQRVGNTMRKKNESKVLQEINKNLSKLAKENNKEKEENNNQKIKETCSERIIVESPEDLDRRARELVDENLVKTYEEVFGNQNELNESKNATKNDSLKSTKTERILDDGSKETKYSNGNVKIISADGNLVTMNYFNGDQKEINNLNGTVKYFYAENESTHTSFPDGTEIIQFQNGQIETKRPDGSYEIKDPDGVVKVTRPDKSEDLSYPDGMKVNISCDGDKEIMFANGQKEIHTKDHMRREYLDGTVKIVYPDGIQETRYSNGRIRIKDKSGKLLLDSHEGNT